MSLNKRLVDLVRKSDNKKLYAEVRISPSRFSDDMSETLTVSFHDFEEGIYSQCYNMMNTGTQKMMTTSVTTSYQNLELKCNYRH